MEEQERHERRMSKTFVFVTEYLSGLALRAFSEQNFCFCDCLNICQVWRYERSAVQTESYSFGSSFVKLRHPY